MAKRGRPGTGKRPKFVVTLPQEVKDYLEQQAARTHRSIPRYVEMLVFRDIKEQEENTTVIEA